MWYNGVSRNSKNFVRKPTYLKENKMSLQDIEKMKKLIADKKAKQGFLKEEKKIGSGIVEKNNRSLKNDVTRTKKISQ